MGRAWICMQISRLAVSVSPAVAHSGQQSILSCDRYRTPGCLRPPQSVCPDSDPPPLPALSTPHSGPFRLSRPKHSTGASLSFLPSFRQRSSWLLHLAGQSRALLPCNIRLLKAPHPVQPPPSHHRLVFVPGRACQPHQRQDRTAATKLLKAMPLSSRCWASYSQGVVNICSPVKTALAPAMKHIACLNSSSVCRPAARRMIVLGSTIRAVAIVRSSV